MEKSIENKELEQFMSDADKAQIEYLENWQREHDVRQAMRNHRKLVRQLHMKYTLHYLKRTFQHLMWWFKSFYGR